MNPSTSQDALAQLQKTQTGAKSAADILASQRGQYGVQGAEDTVKGLRGAIQNTTKLLTNVAPSVMGRTASSLVTSAQANKQIQNEQAPIAQSLSEQGQQYNDANQDYERVNSRASEAANLMYGDQQNKLSYMQNLYNTLFAREQAAEAAKQAELQRQEQIRQFNESLAEQRRASSASSAGGYDLSSLLGGASGGGGAATGGQPSGGGGFRSVLSQKASQGDKNASLALKYVGNDGKYWINFNNPPNRVENWPAIKRALDAIGAKNAYVAPKAGGGGKGGGW